MVGIAALANLLRTVPAQLKPAGQGIAQGAQWSGDLVRMEYILEEVDSLKVCVGMSEAEFRSSCGNYMISNPPKHFRVRFVASVDSAQAPLPPNYKVLDVSSTIEYKTSSGKTTAKDSKFDPHPRYSKTFPFLPGEVLPNFVWQTFTVKESGELTWFTGVSVGTGYGQQGLSAVFLTNIKFTVVRNP
jgi:hypothetical protein